MAVAREVDAAAVAALDAGAAVVVGWAGLRLLAPVGTASAPAVGSALLT